MQKNITKNLLLANFFHLKNFLILKIFGKKTKLEFIMRDNASLSATQHDSRQFHQRFRHAFFVQNFGAKAEM